MKNHIAMMLVCLMGLSLCTCGIAEGETDEEIIQYVEDRFLPLTEVPRPTHHTEKISRFLYDWAVDRGFQAERDEVGNVYYEVPATAGLEDWPLVVLQAHMDMVCVAAEGVSYDPLNDPIKPVVTDETITADGTSLGADDGIGVALSMCAADGLLAHGPIRVIYTVDEEEGMAGVFGMDAKHVADARYLINLDAEQSDAVIASTASGVLLNYSAPAETVPVTAYDTALTITIKDLLSGHSGIDINKGRVNAIRNMAELLMALRMSGVDFAAASLEGGSASNAIPAYTRALLVLHGEDTEKLEAFCAGWQQDMRLRYRMTDPDMKVLVEPANLPDAVLSESALSDALAFVTRIEDGVYTLSPDIIALVESSSNLGKFQIGADGMTAVTYVRSSDAELQEQLVEIQTGIAIERGYDITSAKSADPWKFNPNSRLLGLTEKAYQELNGEVIDVQALHAGLECGTFAVLNPELDMVAIGPDLHDVHTPKETCILRGIPKTYRLLERLLIAVGEKSDD